MRLKTEIAISALLKRAQGAGAFAAIVRKGDSQAGAYMVTVRHKADEDGACYTVYMAERNMQGELIWVSKGPLTDETAQQIINKRVDFDPDLWIVEIEDAQGRPFLDGVAGVKPSSAQAAGEALFQGRALRRKD